jgi:predicted nucleic acid-binding protein
VIAYVDSSILLRFVLGEPGRLKEWSAIRKPISSELIRVECLRTIDRARIRLGLPPREVSKRRADAQERLEAFDIVRIDQNVLERAAEPFPTLIRSLDAIHLASALMARRTHPALVFATHDDQLALCARSEGFRVVGSA